MYKTKQQRVGLVVVFLLIMAAGAGYGRANMGIGITGGIQPFDGLEGYLFATSVLPSSPIVLGVGIQFYEYPVRANMSVYLDWLMLQHPFLDNLIFYSGPGVFSSFPDPFEIGARIPVGVKWFIAERRVELFLETAPTMIFAGDDSVLIPGFKLLSLIGVRFWF